VFTEGFNYYKSRFDPLTSNTIAKLNTHMGEGKKLARTVANIKSGYDT
jgi:hypothetical protein